MGLASPQVLTQHVSLLVKLQVSLSQLISLCQSGPHSAEVARSCSITQKVFCLFVWWVSLYGVPTDAAQLHNVRWTNTCVSLAKNLYMSFHVFALAKHPFTCVHFRKTLLHVFVLAKHHPTQLTFQRTLKFPIQRVVCYSSNFSVTIALVGVSCQTSHDSFYDSQLGKTDGDFSLLVAFIEPSRTIKSSQYRKVGSSLYQLAS